ncbi:MAG: diguanylate cyclase domain-containing protein, partial [Xanthobacteraceae bacterium]
MSYFSDISLRPAITLLVAVLTVLIGGTWLTVKLATDHLVDEYVKGTASDWAHFIADNITDLQQIAAGEQPSAASLAFFEGSRKSNQVLRYVIFNPQGYSQLVVDSTRIALVDLASYSANAARAAKQGLPVVDVKRGSESAGLPSSFGEAYVPVIAGDQPVAVVAAYVDEKEAADIIYSTFLAAVITLCLLMALSFGVPAIAWYLRTREKQLADRRIKFLAHHDPLTGLANRSRLIERLEAALAVLPTTGGMIAVHFIDIDRFKQVNDTLGHDGGDCLLSAIGKRLNAMTRMEDMVARLGGDEFVVVQTGITDRAHAESFARRIGSILSAPVYYKEQEISSTYTIGVAFAPADGATPERLLK